MAKSYNLNSKEDREWLLAHGFRWVVATPQNQNVASKHKTYEAANEACDSEGMNGIICVEEYVPMFD